jgi:hypothetical protein
MKKQRNSKPVRRTNWQQGEAIVFDPAFIDDADLISGPIQRGEVVYFLSNIPNVPGHCIVARYNGKIVAMVHPSDFREAREDEL